MMYLYINFSYPGLTGARGEKGDTGRPGLPGLDGMKGERGLTGTIMFTVLFSLKIVNIVDFYIKKLT